MGNAYSLIAKSCVLGMVFFGLACAHSQKALSDSRIRIDERYGRLPLSFEANTGQTARHVDFLSRGKGYALFLAAHEAVFVLRAGGAHGAAHDESSATAAPAVLKMRLIGASTTSKSAGLEPLPGTVNYFIGSDPKGWRTGIPTYAKVTYPDVYPGIDLIYYGNQRQLEYDFIVAPGGDPDRIWMSFEGARAVEIDRNGDLVLHLAAGEVRLLKPVAYQQTDESTRTIPAEFVLQAVDGTQRIGFELGSYDTSRPLVIDPVLVYSTYLGGSGFDFAGGIAVDADGAAYVVGSTDSMDFPTTPGAFDTSANGVSLFLSVDAFVTKLNPTGSALEYSTYLGGRIGPQDRPNDVGVSIAVDAAGAAYVTGRTSSSDFPTTPGAFDTSFNLGGDAFVTKLDPTGSVLLYSTYLGGSSADGGTGIATDAVGSAYVTGFTAASFTTPRNEFPTTPGAFDTSHDLARNAFVTKLDVTGSTLMYSTYLGGNHVELSGGIAVDAAGNAYVNGNTLASDFPTTSGAFDRTYNGGWDMYVTKLNAAGSALIYSTYLGGSRDEGGSQAEPGAIAVDPWGSAYVAGFTRSSDFPTTVGAFDNSLKGFTDGFVAKINTSGSALEYSTYLGASGSTFVQGIAVDAAGTAHVTGWTGGVDFPTTPGAFDTTLNGFIAAFVTRLDSTGSSLLYSTYLGGAGLTEGRGIVLDREGFVYVAGQTQSPDFPVTPGSFDTTYNDAIDVFMAKLAMVGDPATLSLDPPAATNPVSSEHCVRATVRDAAGNPVPDAMVRFTVAGAVNTSWSAMTDANGQTVFCYMGPALPGADAITAYADTDKDNVRDVGEPTGTAEKTWVLPETAGACRVTIGGHTVADNGERATFGGSAQSRDGVVGGNQQYHDHGSTQPMTVTSINVAAVVCDGGGRAHIFGEATVNGSGAVSYRITVNDLGEPGTGRDTYWILLSDGYSSGEQTLRGGNVQIESE